MAEITQEQLDALAAELGLKGDAAELVKVLPLVYVAWSDGEIQDEERAFIGEQAEALGVKSVEAQDRLGAWLDERPDADELDRGLRLLSYLLATLSYEEAKGATDDITRLCEAVAQAAGGLAGHAIKVDPAERLALQKVTTRLKLGSRASTRKLLREVMALREG